MAMWYFLDRIDPVIVTMGALFLIFLAFISYVLSKVFRDKYGKVNTATVGIISFCISLLIVYFGKDMIYNIVDGLRFSDTIIYVLCAVAILILLYLFRKSLRLCMVLMIIGAGTILIALLTDFFYQKWFVVIIGALIFIGGLAWCLKKKPLRDSRPPGPRPPGPEPRPPGPGPRGITRKRNAYDLKQKYMSYLFQYYRKGNNPQRKKRIKQAMQTIIRTADKMGYPPRIFLSKKIAGQNAKAPSQLK